MVIANKRDVQCIACEQSFQSEKILEAQTEQG
jgi:hypothetical protein